MHETMCANARLLDHLVGGDLQRQGYVETERFRSEQIDDQLELI
jgi:hypothetical protein